MNSLYSLCRRQVTSLQTDLTELETIATTTGTTASLNGQITASLSALNRTIEDYDNMARREIVEVHKEKAMARVARFKDDYILLRKQYEKIKNAGATFRAAADRSSLLSSSSSALSPSFATSAPSSRFSRRDSTPGESPFSAINMSSSSSHGNGLTPRYQLNNPPGESNAFNSSIHNNARTNHALDESSFMNQTGSTLDAYIAQGQAVLGNLAVQKDVLKGTRTRLLSAANTLGLSRDTIQFIERRTKGDFYILIGGGAFTLFSFYLILRWFG